MTTKIEAEYVTQCRVAHPDSARAITGAREISNQAPDHREEVFRYIATGKAPESAFLREAFQNNLVMAYHTGDEPDRRNFGLWGEWLAMLCPPLAYTCYDQFMKRGGMIGIARDKARHNREILSHIKE